VTHAIGQAFERRVAAEAKIVGARVLIGQRHRSSLNSSSEQQLSPWTGASSAAGRGSAYRFCSSWNCSLGTDRGRRPLAASFFAGTRASPPVFAGQIEPRKLADHGVAAHPDIAGDFAQDSPAAKRFFRRSTRSSVQVGW